MSSISTELFFNEAQFRIVIPNQAQEEEKQQDPIAILQAKPREFAFYDEHLQVYLFARVSQNITGAGEEVKEAINAFYNQLEVTVDATFVDTLSGVASSNNTPIMNRSSSATTQSSFTGPTSPKISNLGHQRRNLNDVPTPFFTQAYNRNSKNAEFLLFEHEDGFCCLYPMVVPIVYAKTKSSSPMLAINSNIQYRPLPLKRTSKESSEATTDDSEYDTELFETINLLSGLADDPVFSSNQEPPLQRFIMENHTRQPTGSSSSLTNGGNINASSSQLSMKRSVRENLSIRSGLVVKMRTTNASVAEKMVMMSVELENPAEVGCEFVVDRVEVQVSNAVVSSAFNQLDQTNFPIMLYKSDLMVFVYDVTLLDDGSVKPPTQPHRIFPSRRPLTQQQQTPNYNNDDKIQPQRVSIQIFGSPIIDGKKALPMRSKWNTMLDVSNMRQQKREEIPAPFIDKFQVNGGSNMAMSPIAASMARSQSVQSNNTLSPGARSIVGSPGGPGHQMSPSLEGVFGMKKQHTSALSSPTSQRGFGAINSGNNSNTRAEPEREISDGIVVSFTVPEAIEVGKTFPLHIFIVNRSKHTRRFQVMIPNRKRHPSEVYGHTMKSALPPLPIEQLPIDPYMDESEFLKQYFENETHEADIICLENNVRLSPLGPSTSQSVDIQFIAVKEKLHTIDLVQLVDQDTGFVTNLRHVLEVYVEQQK